MASLEQFIKDFPPITRTYMAAALLTTAACALELVSPFSLYFSWPLIWEKGQVWRLGTNFFFFGARFSLDFIFHMFFLVQYCRSLEEGSFRGRTADFFYMILFGATLLILFEPLAQLTFMGGALTFMMVYIWARRNPFVRMSFLGLFTFTAPYLPWVLLGFSFLLGNDALSGSLGIVIGHIYYFLEDVYPLMTASRTRLLKTPRVLELLFAGGAGAIPAAEHPLVQFEAEHLIEQQLAAQQQQGGNAPPPQQPRDEGQVLVD